MACDTCAHHPHDSTFMKAVGIARLCERRQEAQNKNLARQIKGVNFHLRAKLLQALWIVMSHRVIVTGDW